MELTQADLAQMRRTLDTASAILRDSRQPAGNKRRATLRVLECSFGLLRLLEVALRERAQHGIGRDQDVVP